MKLKKKDWRTFLIILVICLAVIHTMSQWMIDISLSAINTGNNIVTQSLFTENMSPRMAYHIGLLVNTGSFLFLILIAVYFVLKKVD